MDTGRKSFARFQLDGRVALVTGASRGIGRAIAFGFAEHGADVIIHDAGGDDAAERTAAELRAGGTSVGVLARDLREKGAGAALARAAIALFGRVDILVLNAATSGRKSFEELAPADIEPQIATNFVASLELIQGLVPAMAERKWGRVIAIGSVQQVRPNPKLVVYGAMKAAMANVVMNLARAYGRNGITFNNIAPGLIATDSTRAHVEDPAAAEASRTEIALGEIGEPEDCVGSAVMLASEAGRYITGGTIYVDGGMHLPRRADPPKPKL